MKDLARSIEMLKMTIDSIKNGKITVRLIYEITDKSNLNVLNKTISKNYRDIFKKILSHYLERHGAEGKEKQDLEAFIDEMEAMLGRVGGNR